jgi:Flp pilus assembly protein TadD
MRYVLTAAFAALVLVIAVVAVRRHASSGGSSAYVPPAATAPSPIYVGSGACVDCHRAEADKWRASQHAGAMTSASESSVLGNFQNARFTYGGTTSTFFRRDGRFFVRTDGSDGRLREFEIAYTFGVAPLQQYLIAQPGGRLQALGIAWDARPASHGGQRWFHLYPHETITPGDPLHWTGLMQNWNFMCADCHATNLRKGYDARAREFHTTWSETAVGCEACHGPGSAHVDAARAKKRDRPDYGLTARLDERRGVSWQIDPLTGNARRSATRTSDREIEVCARCHARRSQLTDETYPGDTLENAFRVTTIEAALFYPDGQQKDEVYTYATFAESKMYANGVTCSDCHDPHSGGRVAAGNAVCTRCHLATKYNAPSHHFHRPDTPAAQCVTCHMPARTYMVIDPRHDHGFRIPRPDRTLSIGVPNACTTSCHQKEGPSWAATELERRLGHRPGGYQQFAEAFAAFDRGETGAAGELRRIVSDGGQPAIVRASALERLSRSGVHDLPDLTTIIKDPNPLVRRTGAEAIGQMDPSMRLRFGPVLLADPVRSVRIQAATSLADLADQALTTADRATFEHAFDDLVREQQFNADRPEAQANLGQVLIQRGRVEEGIAALRETIRLERSFVPAYVNLADAYRIQGKDPDSERALREGLAASPGSAVLHHSLGLALVRQHRLADALPELERAVTLDPGEARFSYVYAVGLHEAGRRAEAIRVLRASAARHPEDADTQTALAEYLHEK